jgi:hypothetical protein
VSAGTKWISFQISPGSRPSVLSPISREERSRASGLCSARDDTALRGVLEVRRTRTRDVVNMATTILIPVVLALMLLPLLGAAADTDSLYKALKEHGLPVGLIPNSVKNYVLSENGKFKVELEEACYAQIEEPVYYEETIEGELSFGAINNLKGIKVKQLFIWVQVTGVHVDPDSPDFIYFETGILNKKLPTSFFDAPPTCHSESSTDVTGFSDSTVKILRGGTNRPQ